MFSAIYKFKSLIFFCISLILTTKGFADNNAQAQLLKPINFNANLNPFILILGVPTAENGSLTPQGETQVNWSMSLVNNSIQESEKNEAIFLDGETYYSLFSIRHGINDKWELGINLPYIAHHSGQLDDFIKTWHDSFGLTNGRRDKFVDNQLLFNYNKVGSPDFGIADNRHGWGDPLFTAAVNLSSAPSSGNKALRFTIKLPLGEAEKLTSNESANFSVSLAFDDIITFKNLEFGFIGQAGYLYLDKGEVLEDIQRQHIAFASIALNYPITPHVIFKMQTDGQSSFYNSELITLGKESVQFTVGGSIKASQKIWFDFGLVENLQTDTTPDVIFYSMLSLKF